MSSRNLNLFDLNLVRTFLAIWELGSLTAAGDRLGLTQPAVSHALRRLREQFSDPLFVRVGNRMVPTDAATRLYEPFETAIQIVSQTVQGYGRFSPSSSERRFRIAMSDVSEFYFLPQILAKVEQIAPSVELESVQLDTSTVEASLRSGQIDMSLGYLPLVSKDCQSIPLFSDTYVCLIRKDHPFEREVLTEEEFSELTYVDVSTNAPGYQLVEQRLAMIGAKRRIAARIGHITVAPEIVKRTDLAAIYPKSVSERLNENGEFRLLPFPFEIPATSIKLHVHNLFMDDPGIVWLRDNILKIISTGHRSDLDWGKSSR